MTTTKTEKSHDADTGTVITQQLPKLEPMTSHARSLARPPRRVLAPFCRHSFSTTALPGAVLRLPRESVQSLPDYRSPNPQPHKLPNNHFSTSFVYSRILSTLYPEFTHYNLCTLLALFFSNIIYLITSIHLNQINLQHLS